MIVADAGKVAAGVEEAEDFAEEILLLNFLSLHFLVYIHKTKYIPIETTAITRLFARPDHGVTGAGKYRVV